MPEIVYLKFGKKRNYSFRMNTMEEILRLEAV